MRNFLDHTIVDVVFGTPVSADFNLSSHIERVTAHILRLTPDSHLLRSSIPSETRSLLQQTVFEVAQNLSLDVFGYKSASAIRQVSIFEEITG